jgi:hypothetical protein
MSCYWCEWARTHVRAKASSNPGSLTVEGAKALGVQAASVAFNWQVNIFRVVLVGVFLVANALDYYTTKKGLEAGLREKNKFVDAVMRMGWGKYQLIKFVPPAVVAYQALTSEDPNYIWTATLTIGTGMYLYAAIQNWLLIAGRRAGE